MSAERCDHEWGVDYVCTKCSAIKYASAPMWAACLRMKSGPRGVWLALWSFADFGTTAPPPIWPTNAQLRERAGGISESSLQGHLAALRGDRLIRVRIEAGRRAIQLAWVDPFDHEDDAIEGSLYVVEFSDRRIKVGRSSNPDHRIREHAAEGRRAGQDVVNRWASPTLRDSVNAEIDLITGVQAAGAMAVSTTFEYFTNVTFADAVAIAGSIAFARGVQ